MPAPKWTEDDERLDQTYKLVAIVVQILETHAIVSSATLNDQGRGDEVEACFATMQRELAVRQAVINRINVTALTPGQREILCSPLPFDRDTFLWAGMGGASSIEEVPIPRSDPAPGRERNVHDETVPGPIEASVSTSNGVGSMVDPKTAVHKIDDPAISSKWWPDKQAKPRPLSPRNSIASWLGSWLSR